MSRAKKLKWSGNNEAQRQADVAWERAKPKRRKKKRTKVSVRSYYEYIKSRTWKRKSFGFKRQAGNKCERCGATKFLHAHHKHYRTLGRETKEDIEVLCKDCHQFEHEPDGVTMTDELSEQFRAIIG